MAEQARVVIIGGGAVGCSALWHLARAGWRDCLLLEMDELTSGSTWHAAGNCPTFAGSWNIIKYQAYGAKLYRELAKLTDYPINYHATGSLRLANDRERMDEFRHVLDMGHHQGLPYELMSAEEAKARFYPDMTTAGLKGVLWDPLDGDVDPAQLSQAYAKGARDLGARVERFRKVTGLSRTESGEWSIATTKGEIRSEIVVNAAGYFAAEIMKMVGQALPLTVMSHQYLLTETIPQLAARDQKLPLLRDPDISYYLRQERDGLILGPYEWRATPMWDDGLPETFANQLWDDDLERLEWYIEKAIERVPILGEVGVQKVINGPIPYSPDGLPYIGPAHGLPNFYQCCCFSFGIAQSGGAGKTLAEWVIEGEPEWDLWSLDPRRYTAYANQRYCREKAVELYQNEYAISFPMEERPAGRPARATALYGALKAKGARFGARGGWERAIFFDPEGTVAEPTKSLRRARNFDHLVKAEVKAVREACGILDLGGFTKIRVTGHGAEAWLDRLTCSRLPKQGRISLGYMLNERGGVVSEFTITRMAENAFYLISAAAGEWHDWDLLEKAQPHDGSVILEEASDQIGTLVLAGPRARDILQKVTDADLSNKAFPWLSYQMIEIGYARVLAMRVNYVGELGWELHASMSALNPIYERLMAAGADHGLRDFGMYAMESLRLDKAYRGWKSDLAFEYSPLKASLDRFVDLQKPDFVGRKALVAERDQGVAERFVPLIFDEPGDADPGYCASVLDGEERVGLVTSAGWSHTLEKALALAYVRADLAEPGRKLRVDVFGQIRTATVSPEPIYDPQNERLRA